MRETSIYIHIPFCEQKCIYCDFYSVITKDSIGAYLFALKSEIKNYAKRFSRQRKIISIFFGGGTPSLMEADYISEIISEIKNNFNVLKEAEITLETNPGTVNKKKLEAFYKIGINRLSIGVQSFDDAELKILTRIHNRQMAIGTVEGAVEAGFTNVSIDLISNLPKQTKKKWLFNIAQAVKLPIKHISAYSLILESGTVLNKMVLEKKIELETESNDAELYKTTMEFLEANSFNQYEVSNFAKKGFESVHNNSYWHYKDYLSFGTSAHSFCNGKRWWNVKNLCTYLEMIKENGSAKIGEEILSKEQMLDEYVLLGLRSNGIDKKLFIELFGKGWLEGKKSEIKKMIANNFLSENDQKIFLTQKGYLMCDEIIMNLLK